jgi:hypothetical protein
VATSITTIRETAKWEIVELGGKEWELHILWIVGRLQRREVFP